MSIYSLSNFSFDEIQKDKEFTCMKYLGCNTIKIIVEHIADYFSTFVAEELKRSAEDLITNGYCKDHLIIFDHDESDHLITDGTCIIIQRKYKARGEIYINDKNILVLKITVVDNKISYSDIIEFKIPTMEKILRQYQDREIITYTNRKDIIQKVKSFVD